MAHPKRWLVALMVVLVAAGGAALVLAFRGTISIDAVQDWILSFGIWAPVGFVLIYGIATIAMVPGGIFDLTGGALFGPILGSALNLAGGSLGAALSFLVARYIARDWVESRAGPRLQRIMRDVDDEGWRVVAFLRLVPVFPYNVVNFLLGVTRIPFHHYVLATVAFMLPSTIAYTWIGHASRELIAGDIGSIRYALVMLAVLAALFFVPRFIKRVRRA